MTPDDTALPTRDDARAALLPALNARHERVRAAMCRLLPAPPQVLLLEGGLEHERRAMALWYAAGLNCVQPIQPGLSAQENLAGQARQSAAPCLECQNCLQIGANMYNDLHLIDGREESIKIDTVRELRALSGEAPRGGGMRVIILAEAQALSVQAANALLKCLEEPRPGTVFLLLAPQRERLLPTLVSRGWTLTLAWPDATGIPESMRSWEEALARFLRNGQGLFELTGVKGAVDATTARMIVLCLQKGLAAVAVGRGGALAHALERLSPTARFTARDILNNAQESLDMMVNPALVIDALMTRLFVVIQTGKTR